MVITWSDCARCKGLLLLRERILCFVFWRAAGTNIYASVLKISVPRWFFIFAWRLFYYPTFSFSQTFAVVEFDPENTVAVLLDSPIRERIKPGGLVSHQRNCGRWCNRECHHHHPTVSPTRWSSTKALVRSCVAFHFFANDYESACKY